MLNALPDQYEGGRKMSAIAHALRLPSSTLGFVESERGHLSGHCSGFGGKQACSRRDRPSPKKLPGYEGPSNSFASGSVNQAQRLGTDVELPFNALLDLRSDHQHASACISVSSSVPKESVGIKPIECAQSAAYNADKLLIE